MNSNEECNLSESDQNDQQEVPKQNFKFIRKQTYKNKSFKPSQRINQEFKIKSIPQFFLIQRFVKNLRVSTGIMGPPTYQQQLILNDPIYQYQTDKETQEDKGLLVRLIQKKIEPDKPNFFLLYFRTFLHFFSIPIIKSEGSFKIFIEFLCTFISIFECFLIPFELSFKFNISQSAMNIRELIAYVLVIEIIINFKTSIFLNGAYVQDHKLIAINYLKQGFVYDFFTLIPLIVLQLIFDNQYGNYSLLHYRENQLYLLNLFKIIFLFRFQKADYLLEKFIQFIPLSDNIIYGFQLFKMFLLLFFVAHLIGCVWHLVGMIGIYQNFSNSWIEYYQLLNASIIQKYISSIYFAFVTMITVGYGDIIPVNPLEQSLVILLVIVSSVVFAYIMNSIGEIINALSARKTQALQKMRHMNLYLSEMDIDKELQFKIQKYIDSMYDERHQYMLDGTQLMVTLSQSLRQDIYYISHSKIIQSQSIITKNFHSKILPELVQVTKQQSFIPDEIVFKELDNSQIIYFIKYGEIELFIERNQLFQVEGFGKHFSLKKLKNFDSFGELSFFSGKSRSCSAKAIDFTFLFYIQRDDFISIITETNYEVFFLVQETINLYQNLSFLSLQCYGCGKLNHMIKDCPQMHCILSKNHVIEKFLLKMNNKQQRESFQRRETKFQTRKNAKILENNLLRFQNTQRLFIKHFAEQYYLDDLNRKQSNSLSSDSVSVSFSSNENSNNEQEEEEFEESIELNSPLQDQLNVIKEENELDESEMIENESQAEEEVPKQNEDAGRRKMKKRKGIRNKFNEADKG